MNASTLASDQLEELLNTRVSVLLAKSPEVLPLLIESGFTPLQNPVMRAALAPTVTLRQALRLHPLGEEERRLLERLGEIVLCR
jgi:hypothetical protein